MTLIKSERSYVFWVNIFYKLTPQLITFLQMIEFHFMHCEILVFFPHA